MNALAEVRVNTTESLTIEYGGNEGGGREKP